MITIKEVSLGDDYILRIMMSNGNSLIFDMEPYLDTVQFCPLKDKEVWKNVTIHQNNLLWRGDAKVEISVDTLLSLFKQR